MSPEASNFDNERWYGEGSATSVAGKKNDDDDENQNDQTESFELREQQGRGGGRESSSIRLPVEPRPLKTQHEINISSAEFSFRKSPKDTTSRWKG